MILALQKLYQSPSVFKRLAAILLIDIIAVALLIAFGILIQLGEDRGWGIAFGMILFPMSIFGLLIINVVMIITVARTTTQRLIALAIVFGIWYFLVKVMKVTFLQF